MKKNDFLYQMLSRRKKLELMLLYVVHVCWKFLAQQKFLSVKKKQKQNNRSQSFMPETFNHETKDLSVNSLLLPVIWLAVLKFSDTDNFLLFGLLCHCFVTGGNWFFFVIFIFPIKLICPETSCQPVSICDNRQKLSFANQSKIELTKLLQGFQLLLTVYWLSVSSAEETKEVNKDHIHLRNPSHALH